MCNLVHKMGFAFFIIAFLVGPTFASLVDFDSISDAEEGMSVTNQIPGVTFENAILAQYGGSLGSTTYGFAADDEYDGVGLESSFGEEGNWFITDELNGTGTWAWAYDPGTDITMLFDQPVNSVAFEVADINGPDNNPEVLTATYFFVDDDLAPEIVEFTNGGSAGEGSVDTISFFSTNKISKVVVDVSLRDGSNGAFAFGIDNLSFAATPEPTGFVIWGLLILVGTTLGLRRRG